MKKRFQNYFRGWLPQEPIHKNLAVNLSSAPKTKVELDKKLFKTGWIASSIILFIFLTINALFLQPYYNFHVSAEVSVIALGSLALALAAVNLLFYWRYKKQLRFVEQK